MSTSERIGVTVAVLIVVWVAMVLGHDLWVQVISPPNMPSDYGPCGDFSCPLVYRG